LASTRSRVVCVKRKKKKRRFICIHLKKENRAARRLITCISSSNERIRTWKSCNGYTVYTTDSWILIKRQLCGIIAN
jgi:hypothetical protein